MYKLQKATVFFKLCIELFTRYDKYTYLISAQNYIVLIIYLFLSGEIMPAKTVEDCSCTIMGIFGCLRVILPHICELAESQDVETQQTDSLLHIYELCLHYTKWHSKHNIVNAALETLAQLLKMPPKPLVSIFLSSQGVTQSKINQIATLSLGQMSISSTSTAHGGNSDSILNLHELDVPEITPNMDNWVVEAETAPPVVHNSHLLSECVNDVVEMKGKIFENYCGLKIGVIDSKNKRVNTTEMT